MANLTHMGGQRSALLTAEHSIGRSSACLLQLDDPRASGHHALVRWSGTDWELLDLGSRNGTFLGGERLEVGQRRLLTVGARLAFGSEADVWVLADAGPPVLMARSADGALVVAEDELLVFQNADGQAILVYVDGALGLVEERSGGAHPLPRDNTLVIDAQVWTVHPPARQVATQTVADAAAAGPSIVFQVSQDEEHIELFIEQGGRSFSVAHRAQHELLLLLARHRAEDMAAGVVDSEQGWRYCDEVQRDLRLEENHFNVSVFRARKHLEKAGIVGAKGIIERRRGSGQVRLGSARFRIEQP